MPQLDAPMFTDQIFFMSVIFYLGHIYTNEVILPNISALKQYRQAKLNSLFNKVKTSSIFSSNCQKNEYNKFKLHFSIINKELSNFNYVLTFLVFFNYKQLKKNYKDKVNLNNSIIKKNFK